MQDRGFSIGKVFGIEIRLDPSLIIVFALIVVSLGLGLLPAWHPTWHAGLIWLVAAAAGVLFLASVLVHEFAHSLVAKAYGLSVDRITLFVFGGAANVEEEPQRPGVEFLMAGVGPLTSIVLGVLFLLLAELTSNVPVGAPPAEVVQHLGPVATLFAWLGPVNILLGVFNLLPGFPLDGGRMLRAVLWKTTGDLVKATRWAAAAGTVLGWIFVALGVAMALGVWVPLLGTGLLGGLWIALIGWFLTRLATWTYRRTVLENVLGRVPVGELMAEHLLTVPSNVTLRQFADDYVGRNDQLSWPVMDGERLVGIARSDDLARVPSERWAELPLSTIVVPADQLPEASPTDKASEALQKLGRSRTDHVQVRQEGRLVGFLRQADIVRWLHLHGDGMARP